MKSPDAGSKSLKQKVAPKLNHMDKQKPPKEDGRGTSKRPARIITDPQSTRIN